MIKIHVRVGLRQVRQLRPYETNSYMMEIEDDIHEVDIHDKPKWISETFAMIRKHLDKQKKYDGIVEIRTDDDES